jgi:FkbM family methyltransferase
MTFRQQFLEDFWLSLFCEMPAKGFYVDVGAADPEEGSMTDWLRQRGWEGLAIDGNPAWAPRWEGVKGVDFVSVVLAEPGVGAVQFAINEANPWESRIHKGGALSVATSLQRVLDSRSVQAIDFLCVDVEGAEFDVLQGFDLRHYWPRIIVSEYRTRMGEGQRDAEDYRVRDFLLGTGRYELINQTLANLIFRIKP